MFARRRLPFDRLTPAEVEDRLSTNSTLILDVREPHELRMDGRIAGATHIPMNNLPDRLAELPADAEIVVYCAHGHRSMTVAKWLVSQGYTNVKDLSGGLAAWIASGHPVERG